MPPPQPGSRPAPASGGTYVYGLERLGEFWGYLAGWRFVVGKTASCAAMALTVGFYVWPGQAHAVAAAAVVALTAVNYARVQKSAVLTRAIVAVVLAVLAAVVAAALTSGETDATRPDVGPDATVGGVLQAAGLLFFAFAGYARIATPGKDNGPRSNEDRWRRAVSGRRPSGGTPLVPAQRGNGSDDREPATLGPAEADVPSKSKDPPLSRNPYRRVPLGGPVAPSSRFRGVYISGI